MMTEQLHEAIDRINALEKTIEMDKIVQAGKHAYQLKHVQIDYEKQKQIPVSGRIAIPVHEKTISSYGAIAPGVGLNASRMPNSHVAWCPIIQQESLLDEEDLSLNARVTVTTTSSHPANVVFQTDPNHAWGKKTNGYSYPFVQKLEFNSTQWNEAVSLTWSIEFNNQYRQIDQANALYIQPFAIGFNTIESIRIREKGIWRSINMDLYPELKEGKPGWVHMPCVQLEQIEITAKCFIAVQDGSINQYWIGFDQIGLYQFDFASQGKIAFQFDLPRIDGIEMIRPMHFDENITFELFRKTNNSFTKVELLNWMNSFEASTWAIIGTISHAVPDEFVFKGVFLDVIAATEG